MIRGIGARRPPGDIIGSKTIRIHFPGQRIHCEGRQPTVFCYCCENDSHSRQSCWCITLQSISKPQWSMNVGEKATLASILVQNYTGGGWHMPCCKRHKREIEYYENRAWNGLTKTMVKCEMGFIISADSSTGLQQHYTDRIAYIFHPIQHLSSRRFRVPHSSYNAILWLFLW